MDTLKSFETELVSLIGKPTGLRPFVCDGSPLECDAFVVGINPATSMSADFWQFWRSDYGFDKAAWFEAYLQDRKLQPMKPGKTRRNSVSNTRRVIDWILEEASPVRCLETNIYAAPTEQAVDLPPEQRITTPFDYLLEKLQPRLIVVHGEEAASHIQSKNYTGQIIKVSHLSRGWSQVAARELGLQIKQKCKD